MSRRNDDRDDQLDRGGGERGDQLDRGDRPKKEKKRRRSQSSDSAQRSREKEMKRRQKQQQHANRMSGQQRSGAPGIPDPGVGGQRMFWDGFQWVPRADNPVANPNDPNVSRKMRRLYLGNLPYHLGITEDSFSKQLYDTMKERGLCNDPNQNPVLHIWFARDKGANYGFCEMASIEESDRVLQLDGIMVLGVAVSIKRPTDAQQPAAGAIGMAPAQVAPLTGGPMLALPPLQVQATSSIIHIEQLLTVNSTTVKQDYDDVVADMKEGCGQHGKIKHVFIVRRSHSDKVPELKAGDVFLQCTSLSDATKIMRAMGHRKYDGRQISMKSHDEYKWHNVIEPLI